MHIVLKSIVNAVLIGFSVLVSIWLLGFLYEPFAWLLYLIVALSIEPWVEAGVHFDISKNPAPVVFIFIVYFLVVGFVVGILRRGNRKDRNT